MWVASNPAELPRTLAGVEAESSIHQQSPIGAQRVTLHGAVNESLSFCFAVRSMGKSLPLPRLIVSPFRSSEATVDPASMQVFRLHRVAVGRWPGWHIRSVPPRARETDPLDALVPIDAPRGGLPHTLEADETYYFWVDVYLPKGTSPGRYHGRIELLSEGAPVAHASIDLQVWPFMLPDEIPFHVVAALDHRDVLRHHVHGAAGRRDWSNDDWQTDPRRDDIQSAIMDTMRMLRAHRVTPVLQFLAPIVKVDAAGDLNVDWSNYDAIAAPCLSGKAFFDRAPIPYWPMPLDRMLRRASATGRVPSEGYSKLVLQYVSQCITHFAEKGWLLDRSYMDLDEPSAVSSSLSRRIANAVHGANPGVAILFRGRPRDVSSYGPAGADPASSVDLIDIWAPAAQFYDPDVMAERRARGERTWLSIDRPPFSGSLEISGSKADARVLSWQARQLGAEVLYIGELNDWPATNRQLSPSDCVRHATGVLIYPGDPYGLTEPIASVRLKHLRRSMQDAAYAALLDAHGLQHVVSTCARALAPYAGTQAYRTSALDGLPSGWIGNDAVYESARRLMAGELIRKVYPAREQSGSDELRRTAEWRRFVLASHGIRLTVDGTRIRLVGNGGSRSAEVECVVTIYNHTRVPVSGDIRLANLPKEWTRVSAVRTLEPIAPGASKHIALTARATYVPTGVGGFVPLVVALTTTEGVEIHTTGRAAFVNAQSADGNITIDGDLADWAPGAGNVLADFALVTTPDLLGRRSSPLRGDGNSASPKLATRCFVARDRDNLYFALNCESARDLPTAGRKRKSVQYDDLVPVGEELIEILLEPLNAGTRTPEDLFHIVVKQSGTDLLERGIDLVPNQSIRHPWAADIEVATSSQGDRWFAEVRIPFAAFGPHLTEGTVWGLNVTRFDATNQEFSTWSGASGNAYDPLSLGNLLLQPVQ
ncbi:MAG: DUF4091 domain-containing protein [Planctomycetes bacterium]|nr:DUF4091 domain-containing protein [Planctomycetota bacterium]